MSYTISFKNAVTPQPSPKAKIYHLADYLRGNCPEELGLFVRSMPPVKLTNPHIWEAAMGNLRDEYVNYAVALIAHLSYRHDIKRDYIEGFFDECEAQSRPHFSISDEEYALIRRTVVTPCYPFSRFMPENQRSFDLF